MGNGLGCVRVPVGGSGGGGADGPLRAVVNFESSLASSDNSPRQSPAFRLAGTGMKQSFSAENIAAVVARLKKITSRDDLRKEFREREKATASLKCEMAVDWLPEYHPPSIQRDTDLGHQDTVVERISRISEALLLQDVVVSRKTKIVCTLGPACWSAAGLKSLLAAGMNVARFNFSHGTHEAHQEVLDRLRKVATAGHHVIGYLLDTKGPEVRTAMLRGGKDIELVAGQDIIVAGVGDKYTTFEGYKDEQTGETKIGISYAKLCASSKPGNIILIADGVISIEVVRILNDTELLGKVINSHKLGQRKNCNLPGVKVDLPVLAPSDIIDIQQFGVKNDMDFVAASFVQSADDVKFIRKVLNDAGNTSIKIVAKIENEAGLRDIDGIIAEADGIMVARGDLAMEVPAEKIALAQKMIITKCNNAGKLVITATQMLESMIENPLPTRAEMTDVANAVFDGTDAVMLSGETANGSYPEVAVRTMARIVEHAELGVDHEAAFDAIRHANSGCSAISPVEATLAGVAKSAVLFHLDANGDGVLDATEGCIAVVLSRTGYAAAMVSKYRPPCPVIVVSDDDQALRGCTASYGLYPLKLEYVVPDVVMVTAKALHYAQQINLDFNDKSVIVVSGSDGLWADDAPQFTVDYLGSRIKYMELEAKVAAYRSPFAGNSTICMQSLRIAPGLIIEKQFNYRSTKIVATMNPTSTSEQMDKLVKCGISVARFNLSFEQASSYQVQLDRFCAVCDNHEKAVAAVCSGAVAVDPAANTYTPRPAVMVSMQGPEIRTSKLRGGKALMLKADQDVILVASDIDFEGYQDEGTGETRIGIALAALCSSVGPGDIIILAEGTVKIEVSSILSATELRGRCLYTKKKLGQLRHVEIPGLRFTAPTVTDKDKSNIAWVAQNKDKIDFVTVPFVQSAEDVKIFRTELDCHGAIAVQVIAQIDSPEAISNFDAILDASDGIMVSRGNLGMRMTPEKVTLAQKWMITKANLWGKPIMISAQIMESMVENPRPTRAEMTDVANAAYDGADAIVFRTETAIGLFPDKVVTIAAAILRDAEVGIDSFKSFNYIRNFTPKPMSTLEAVCSSAVKATLDMGARLLVLTTNTLFPIQAVAKYRPHCTFVVVTQLAHIARQANISYGAVPFLVDTSAAKMEDIRRKVVAFAHQLRLTELASAHIGSSDGGNGTAVLCAGHLVLLRGPSGSPFAVEEDLAQLEFCVLPLGDPPPFKRPRAAITRSDDTVAFRSTKVSLDLICSPINVPRKTKIICTLGPKCWSEEGIAKLIDGGMNIARFNFSHGSHADHQAVLDRVRKVAAERQSSIAVLLDTKGPEVRTAMLRGHTPIDLEGGQSIIVVAVGDAYTSYEGYKDANTGETRIGLSYAHLCQDVKAGSRILIGDGTITIEVVQILSPTELEGKVLNSKKLGERKNCNLPGVKVRLPVLTEGDVNDVQNFAVKNGMDFVAASFVQTGDDVRFIRKTLDAAGGQALKIISKIESACGLQEFDEILEESDGIMVARGDLAMEIPSEKVTLAQKMMITKANLAGKFIVTATQMLESMIDNPLPTRAEMTDVANAVFDGTDAVMLSGETANGEFPDRAVATMAAIAANAEVGTNYYQTYDFIRDFTTRPVSFIEAVLSCAAKDSLDVDADLIVIISSTGDVARMASKYRPRVPILVVTASPQVARHLSSSFSLYPYLVPELPASRRDVACDLLLEHAILHALGEGLCGPGKEVVVVHGTETADAEGSPMYFIKVAPGDPAAYVKADAEALVKLNTLSLRTTAISLADVLDYAAPPRKTKVVCTLGPSCWSEAGLKALLDAGMNVARFNFSHGTHEAHQEVLDRLRKVEGSEKRIAYLLDTKGPEVRTAMVRGGKNIELVAGQELTLVAVGAQYDTWEGYKDEVTGETKVGISYDKLATSVKPGGRILIADGTLSIEVVRIASPTEVVGRCLNSKSLGPRKNCNLPGVKVDIPVLTEKDIQDLQKFCCKNKMDFVAASFVQTAEDVHFIRRILDQAGGKNVKIISKIENEAGLMHYDAILRATDGIMVARGDLAMEIPSEKVALAQKMMITKANIAGKIVITATQMLESMISNPLPTRAEMTDVANAVFDGTDAVMLSGETANGKFSDVAVKTMAAIVANAENSNGYVATQLFIRDHTSKPLSRAEALGAAVAVAMVDCNAQLIVVISSDGRAARMVCKYRPAVPVIVVTNREDVARRSSVVFGLYAVLVEDLTDLSELVTTAKEYAEDKKLWNGEGCGILLSGKLEPSADVQGVMRAVNLAQMSDVRLLSLRSALPTAFSLRG